VSELHLRTADLADEEFLRELFFEVRRDQYAVGGLPEHQLGQLLEFQLNAQRQAYRAKYPEAVQLIIAMGTSAVGHCLINRTGSNLRLIDIAVRRDERGMGIGSAVLETLKKDSDSIELSVFQMNLDAIRLYQIHGFVTTGGDDTYKTMEWKRNG
jgi:ribosomal protein S18 acetylase RimI-like enzyme